MSNGAAGAPHSERAAGHKTCPKLQDILSGLPLRLFSHFLKIVIKTIGKIFLAPGGSAR